MLNQAEEWLNTLERSGLPGKYKVCGYQHGILPRLLWPLLVYEVPLTTVETLERRINSFLRRWLFVPKSFCSIGLYSSGSKLQLPITSVVEEFKTAKVRLAMMLRDSNDQAVRQANIVVKTGRKWKASGALREAKERLRHGDIMGTVTQGRLGLGVITRASWKEARAKERKGMVQKEIKAVEEESRQARAVAMKQQGSWTRWEGVRGRSLSWKDIWNMEGHRIKFLLSSVYDVLPTPTNLQRWRLTEDAGLTEGRFRWRHDQVLAQLADGLEKERKRKRTKAQDKGPRFICFLRPGEKAGKEYRHLGILGTADDWEMRVDLGRQLKFPEKIAVTSLRPDIVLWSQTTRQVALIELTVPWEERIEEAHERKLGKYHSLISESQQGGWRAWNLPVEVGCKGFPGQSLWRALGMLGVKGATRKNLVNIIAKQAETAK
ncbi:hypothetical protein DPEC_G00248160 [Dallia pectoralis]|uniref:Uncharacterized protein n=1 Tax=Dallia pectoralis TaxID=75939 RepID=A0ACC2FWN4_DALPE|nr:hypothetical protein DPEC_G00248160 [Dallia pectoralis]